MTACAAVLMNSCQKTPAEKKEGVPMTIQASVIAPASTKTMYDYTDDKTLEGFWDSEEAITVVSFGQNGITAVDTFTSIGEAGRKQAEFSGTGPETKVTRLSACILLWTRTQAIRYSMA